MFYDQEFIDKVEDDPITGIVDGIALAMQENSRLDEQNGNWNERQHELLWETSSFVDLVIRENDFSVPDSLPSVSSDVYDNCNSLINYMNNVANYFEAESTKIKISSYTSRYETALKSSFAYEFSQGDFDRVQALVSELREIIAKSEDFEEGHKRRLLKRLEQLQSELHKRVSDMDHFWGLIGDAGVIIGKFGRDSKPMVDRIKEIAQIAWNTQARTEELPSDFGNPMLQHDEE